MEHASNPIKPQAAISPLPPTSSDEAEFLWEQRFERFAWDEQCADVAELHEQEAYDPNDFDDFETDEDET